MPQKKAYLYLMFAISLMVVNVSIVFAQKEGSIITGKFVFKLADNKQVNTAYLKEVWADYGVSEIKEKFPFIGKISIQELQMEGSVNLNLIYEATLKAPIDVN